MGPTGSAAKAVPNGVRRGANDRLAHFLVSIVMLFSAQDVGRSVRKSFKGLVTGVRSFRISYTWCERSEALVCCLLYG